ncbi:MAG: methyl-accepting chemotaxis protein [Pseudomonadota bacterium]
MKSPVGRSMSLGSSINRWILTLSILLLVGLFVMAGSFIYATFQSQSSSDYVSLVGEQQLLSQRVSTNALEASRGMAAPGARLNAFISRFDSIQQVFRNGDPVSGLAPLSGDLIDPLNALDGEWQRVRSSLAAINNGLPTIRAITEISKEVQQKEPRLVEEADRIASLLISNRASQELVYAASRQLMLIQRMSNNLSAIANGKEDLTSAAKQLGEDQALMGNVIDGMLGVGSNPLRITQVRDAKAVDALRRLRAEFREVSAKLTEVVRLAPEMSQISASAQVVSEQSASLLAASTTLREALLTSSQALDFVYLAGALGAALVIASLGILAYMVWKDSERRIDATTEQNRRNQRAILRLLDEMTNLADGDLSSHATVTEDITGAIADSVNYAIDALRSLVATINRTSVQVSGAAGRTQSTAARLADASSLQAREIASASASISEMAETMTRMSENAADSQSVALSSVSIAKNGAETVQRNIDAMDSIREQIQETSKRIKRLGESSQEIGDIIGLINEIADRTNILALNAAIQASTAGEAGRGFAVVADEVQRLAERAGDATKQVEALVKTIQADTSEAVASMEQSTSGVVSGAKLAENAGAALTEVETVSEQLAGLIQNMSKEASQQADVANTLSNNMSVIRDITVQTSDGTTETANSIGKLTSLANELRESVSGFQLPDEDQKMMDSIVMQADGDRS